MPDPNSYAAIGWSIVSLGALMLLVERGIALLRIFRGHPPVEELKGGADVLGARVNRLEHEQSEGIVRRRAIHEKIDTIEKRVRDESRKDLGAVYSEIGKLRSEMKEDTALLHRRIDEVKAQIDESMRHIPNELVALLRNTGAIK